jgi:hypothetical protein
MDLRSLDPSGGGICEWHGILSGHVEAWLSDPRSIGAAVWQLSPPVVSASVHLNAVTRLSALKPLPVSASLPPLMRMPISQTL